MSAQLAHLIALAAFWTVMVPLLVGIFYAHREPPLYPVVLWGMLGEAALSVFLMMYLVALALVLVYLMHLVVFVVRYDEYYHSYQRLYGIPKQHLPSWLRDTPHEIESLEKLDDKPMSAALTGELIDAPRPGDMPTERLRKPKGYHRPESVAERTGEHQLPA